MNQYLFLFTITPVQAFIRQARKTHDLYTGSRLLSDLMTIVIEEAAKNQPKGEKDEWLIFPQYKEGTESQLPNRFLSIMEFTNLEAATKWAAQLETKINKQLEDIAANTLSSFEIKQPSGFAMQLSTFIQPYWVFVPYKSKDHYQKAYKEAVNLLGGLKLLRGFAQLPEVARQKCLLCGERNALFYKTGKSTEGEKKIRNIVEDSIEIKDEVWLVPGEILCAICLLKRLYQRGSAEFPSTSQIALMNLLHSLHTNQKGKDLLGNYQGIVEKESRLTDHPYFRYFNASLLYEENLTPQYFRNEGLEAAVYVNNGQEYISQAIIAAYDNLHDFICVQKKQKSAEQKSEMTNWNLTRYYAALLFDGDNMGEWLSGEKVLEGKLYDYHRQLSNNLVKFANKVVNYIHDPIIDPVRGTGNNNSNNWFGKIVYAGGEDFLGFLNLYHALPALEEIRKEFAVEVNNNLEALLKKDAGLITFSAGLLFAHYKTPLSEVLKKTRELEEKAKNCKGKDSLAIAVMSRSGELKQAVFKWSVIKAKGAQWVTVILRGLVKELALENFSNTFIRSLYNEFYSLAKMYPDEMDPLIRTEIKRLVTRSCLLKRKNAYMSEQDFQQRIKIVTEYITLLWDASAFAGPIKISNFLSGLAIVDFLAKEVNS